MYDTLSGIFQQQYLLCQQNISCWEKDAWDDYRQAYDAYINKILLRNVVMHVAKIQSIILPLIFLFNEIKEGSWTQ